MNLMPNRLTTEIQSTVLPYIMQKLQMYMQKDLAVELNATELEQKTEVEQVRKHKHNLIEKERAAQQSQLHRLE